MFNTRTWHRLCISALVMFPGVLMLILLPEDSYAPLLWIAIALLAWGMLVAVLGAIQGILLACGKLKLGCPVCDETSEVLGGGREGMDLDCPKCGDMTVKIGSPFGMKVTRHGRPPAADPSDDDDQDAYGDFVEFDAETDGEFDTVSGYERASAFWSIPKAHPAAFITVMTPVIGTVIAASVIYRFSFFYLLIPLFWCYGVGSFIVQGIATGKMSDSHGTVLRSEAPVRFWASIGIWSFFYILAASFPIGFSLQERAREAAEPAEKIEAEANAGAGQVPQAPEK